MRDDVHEASRTYFVTGASGFIGMELCDRLLARGCRVKALVRGRNGPPLPGVEVVRASLEQPERYADALADAHYVVHLAGDARFGNGPHYESVNTEGTRVLLDACVRHAHALERFVFVSTVGAVDRCRPDACKAPLDDASSECPRSDYGRSKLAAERLVAESGLPYSIARPCMVTGAAMRVGSHISAFVSSALRGGVFSRLSWPGGLSVVHVGDVAEALMLLATRSEASGKAFFIAGERVEISAVLEAARPGVWRLPLGWGARLAGLVPWAVPFAGKVLLRDALVANDAELRALGWSPGKTGPECVAEVVEREQRRLDPDRDVPGRALVTGAASGLGRAVAELLAAKGRRLLLVDRDAVGLDSVLHGHANVRREVVDLADAEAVQAFLDRYDLCCDGGTDPVDELYACAGFGLRGTVADLPRRRQEDIIKVNLLSRFAMVHALLPGMRRRRFGRIVLVGSSSAYQPMPYMSMYAASNAALHALAEGLYGELRGQGVEVLLVCPGGMATRFQQSAGVRQPEGENLMSPERVAEELFAALGRDGMVVRPSLRSKGMFLVSRMLPRRLQAGLWERLMRVAR